MVEGWYFIAAALLVISGGSKIKDPEPTRGALRSARLPSSRGWVFVLGLGEVAVGAVALAIGSPWTAVAVGALYLAFAGFVTVALAMRLPIQSCGCFGKSDTPPGWLHVAANLTSVVAAGFVAATGGADLLGILAAQPGAGVPYVGFLAMGAFLLALVLSELPAVLGSRRL